MGKIIEFSEKRRKILNAIFLCKSLNIHKKADYVKMQIQLPQFNDISWELIESILLNEEKTKTYSK